MPSDNDEQTPVSPQPGRLARRSWRRSLLPELTLLGLLLALKLLDPAALVTLRNAGFDRFQGLHTDLTTPASVAVIRIGEHSLTEVGPWPWPRADLAELVDGVVDAGAEMVVLVDLLSSPDHFGARSIIEKVPDAISAEVAEALSAYPDSDTQLARALARRPAILATALAEDSTIPLLTPAFSLPLEGAISDSRITFRGLITALPALREAAAAEGAMNLFPERDMVLRRAPTVFQVGGNVHPTIAVAALAAGPEDITVVGRRREVAGLQIDGELLETDDMGRIWLDFSRRGLIETIEAADIPELGAGTLTGRIAIIGADAVGLTAHWRVADGNLISGPLVVASTIDAIQTGTTLARPDFVSRLEFAVIFLIGLITILIWRRCPPFPALLLTGTGAALWLGAVIYSRVQLGLVVDAVLPIVFLAVLAAASAFMRARSLARERQLLIIEKLETEQRLFQAQKMEAVGQLTGGIAHDFNNLLTVIYGNLELINAKAADPGLKPMLAAALRSVKRGTGLVKQLLVFGREAELSPKLINLNECLRGMQSMIRLSAPASVTIETSYGDGLPAIRIDEDQLTSAILNVVINARDAMPNGGALHIVTATEVLSVEGSTGLGMELPAGQFATISISDTGTGMNSETIAKVFEPFFTTKGVGEGTGLGLSMVYGFLHQSGGGVAIDSRPGEGTTVKFYLPAAETGGGEIGTEDKQAVRRSKAGETILLVEDETDVREVIAAQLKRLGYNALAVGEVAAALSHLHGDRRIDALLTDIAMPGQIQGPDLARRAQELRSGLPVIFMTGYPNRSELRGQQAEDRGNLLIKPVTAADLSNAIWHALNDQAPERA